MKVKSMNLVISENYDGMSLQGARILKELTERKPDASVVLAVGNTPTGMYRRIAQMRNSGLIDLSRLTIFQLDGYLGLDNHDPRSLEGWLRSEVIMPWGIPNNHFIRLAEDGEEPENVCRAYEQKVRKAGGFDLAVLGLGPNGHLGFNEPPSPPDCPTRVVTLTNESIRSNAQYWGGADRVPRRSITAGMNILLDSRHIVLLVSGSRKQEILKKTLEGAISPQIPSSYLQRHPNVTIIADQDAWPVPS